MRYIAILLLPLLSACAPQYTYKSPEEQIVQKCSEAGYVGKEHDDCVTSATAAYKKEVARQEKEWAKEVERRNKEMIKAQKEAKRKQLEADGAKCKDYGFAKGTKDFAACMMQVEMARKQDQQQQEALAAQQQVASQQIEANRKIAASQMLQNYFLQQQAIQAQQNIAARNRTNNMMNNNIDCTSYQQGRYVHTNCW